MIDLGFGCMEQEAAKIPFFNAETSCEENILNLLLFMSYTW